MLVVMVRTLILYLTVVISVRIMGKRQIGEMQPSELVVAIMISDLASVPMQTIDIPLLTGVIPVITLLVCEIIMSYVCLKSKRIRRYITGEPDILVRDGHINERELARLRLSLNDLTEQLRLSGCPDISKVRAAVLETNGQLSVIEASPNEPELPYVLITDGDINLNELERADKTEKWLKAKLNCDPRDVFFAMLDTSGRLHIQKKGEEDKK